MADELGKVGVCLERDQRGECFSIAVEIREVVPGGDGLLVDDVDSAAAFFAEAEQGRRLGQQRVPVYWAGVDQVSGAEVAKKAAGILDFEQMAGRDSHVDGLGGAVGPVEQ